MSEEEKAIKWLENKTTSYSLESEVLHYYIILYYLIINLQQENNQLKDRINKAIEYMKEKEKQGTLWFVKSTDELFGLLKGDKE